jgi:nitroreductase
MNVIEALKQRKSVRAFLDKAVSDETINTLFEAARHSPSSTNCTGQVPPDTFFREFS